MKNKTKSVAKSDIEQSRRFIEAARKAGANETKEGADRAFKKIIQPHKRAAKVVK